VGKRHDLPFLTVINEDGIIVGDCVQFNVSQCSVVLDESKQFML
jgi:filamentous hemagglutinin family protein